MVSLYPNLYRKKHCPVRKLVLWYNYLRRKTIMNALSRITFDPQVMGGKPCLRGLRVTVGTIVGLVATGKTTEDILRAYPYLEAEDVSEALAYAAWRVEEAELPLMTV
jgi:uncharacterized protein (DUF433 family)